MIRAGLELDPDKLWELRVMVAKATFIPCFMEVPAINVTFTMIWWQAGSVAILAHFLCGFPWTVGFAVGFLLAAVSLAVSWFWWFWSWKANNRYFFRIIVWECSLGHHSSHPAVDRSGLGPGKGGDDNEQDHEVWWTRWSRNHVIASLLLLESLAGIATYFSGHSDTCHLCLCCRWCRCNIRVRCIIIIIQWKCTNYWFLVSFGIFLGISFSEDADTTQLLLHGPIEVKTIMENTITSYRRYQDCYHVNYHVFSLRWGLGLALGGALLGCGFLQLQVQMLASSGWIAFPFFIWPDIAH